MKHHHILIMLLIPAFALAAIIGQPAVQALSSSFEAAIPTTIDTTIVHNTDTLVGAETVIPGEGDATQSAGEGTVSDGTANLPQTPEAPATDGFVPTMMSDLEAADPTTGLTFIAPPTANNRGTASLQYPLQMPPARNGMQPQLTVSYSSDGGSGWLGEGWDIAVPSITVDTRWGVPRYNAATETETYLLNGQMLCFADTDGNMHVAHRGDPKSRTSDRRFFTRQGGDFSRIIRKGNSPANYYWEMTDTRGTRYFYGSKTSSRLSGTVAGCSVIAEWRLDSIVELHGDYIAYEYRQTNETAFGALPTNAIYLSEVRAGNVNETAHTVVTFHNNAAVKLVRQSSARYGFLTSSNALLDSVTVTFRGSLFRSYGFSHSEGAFHREHLDAIRQYDAAGELASFQTFDYYDDTEGGTKVFMEDEEVELPNAGLSPLFPISSSVGGNFSNVPTALGGTSSTSWGTSLYIGAGGNNGSIMKDGTAGLSVNYGQDASEGVVTFLDINGDGLPDKVFRKGGEIRFCPGTKSGSLVSYGTQRLIEGLSHIQKTKSTSLSGGGKIVVGSGLMSAMKGKDYGKTTTKTTDYFLDVNGDGLPDMVSGGRVLFNHVEQSADGIAVPVFTDHSNDTDSPILLSGAVSDNLYTTDSDYADTLQKYSPKIDLVRVWDAPRSGNVIIGGTVRRIVPTGNYDSEAYDRADSLRVAIQTSGHEIWQKSIEKGETTAFSYSKSLSVVKGQKIYFRLQAGYDSLSNGDFDKVLWRPTIVYTSVSDGLFQPTSPFWSGLNYSFDSCRINSTAGEWYYVGGRPFRLSGSLYKYKTLPCDVTVSLVGEGQTDPLAEWVFPKGSVAFQSKSLTGNYPNPDGLEKVRVEVSSEVDVDWQKFIMSARIISHPADNMSDTTQLIPWFKSFSDIKRFSRPYTLTSDTVLVTATSVIDQDLRSRLVMCAQVEGDTARLSRSNAQGYIPPISIDGKKGKRLWVTYYYDGTLNVKPTLPTGLRQGEAAMVSVNSGLCARRDCDEQGHHYRGWGQFAYNTKCSTGALLDEELLDQPVDTTLMKEGRSAVFALRAKKTSMWQGPHKNIYCALDTMSAGRLSEQDVRQTSPVASALARHANAVSTGQSDVAVGITQISENKTVTDMTGVSVGTLNTSSGRGLTKLTMMDMNGDGYPDVVGDGGIQYTLPTGGLSQEISLADPTAIIESASSSTAVSLGGDPVNAYNTVTSLIRGGKGDSNNRKVSSSPYSIQASEGNNSDVASRSFADVNGDGLPDKLYRTQAGILRAALNLGYSFSQFISLGNYHITEGETKTDNLGGGVSLCSGSISAGLSLTGSSTEENHGLTDVNGDGLADYVSHADDQTTVRLGNGYGFDNIERPLTGAAHLSHSSSTSLGGSVAYTACFPLLFAKIVVNPGVSASKAIYRPRAAFMDVDGDGFPDYVESEDETTMSVRYSAIRRTNKLRSVGNSLGGTFTIDYAHSAPTYGLPGGKWVMSAVTVDDGIHDDGPVQRSRFEYADGRRDRHEREFLGFGEVQTVELDTENGDAPYRRTVEEYDVSSVYSQGNLLSTAVMDADGNLYTKTTNSYYGYLLKSDASGTYSFTDKTNSDLTSAVGDAGMAYCPLRFTETRQYDDNNPSGRIMSQEHFTYSTISASRGALSAYRYSDKGNMTISGSNYTLRRTYSYNNDLSRNLLRRVSNCNSYSSSSLLSIIERTSFQYGTTHNNYLLPTLIKKYITSSSYAQTDLTYDSLGNLTSMLLPQNHKNERMGYSYEYEPTMNMHVKKITDSFALTSEVERFDYSYGVPLDRVDTHGYHIRTYLDAMGRPVRYVSPMEQASVDGNLPDYDQQPDLFTVRYEYHPMAQLSSDGSIFKPAYAVTKHYDARHPGDPIVTVTFVDGFGRPIQVKKESVVDGNHGYIRSGKTVYDAFGRVSKTYYPTFNQNDSLHWYLDQDMVAPTRMVYDILNRETRITLPDNTETATAYSLSAVNSQNVVVAEVTDALNHKTATSTNGSGQTVCTTQYNDAGNRLNTTFVFDPLGRLTKVTDTEGNQTTSTYDMLGRRLKVSHPASGTAEYTYDKAGNLTSKQLPNLVRPLYSWEIRPGRDTLISNSVHDEAALQDVVTEPFNPGPGETYPFESTYPTIKCPIRYYYKYNRLDSIVYPFHPENNVYYYYGGANSRHACEGRVALRVDGSGAIDYSYDQMGNVSKTRRTLIVANEGMSTFSTEWKYDSFGRLLSMTYPDQEHIFYGYDLGGQPTSVTGYKETYNYSYVRNILYNQFGQRSKMLFGKNLTTEYYYDDNRRWLNVFFVYKNNDDTNPIAGQSFFYDAVGNITKSIGANGKEVHYSYDALDRLTDSYGVYGSSSYTLSMGYDDMYRVTSKVQRTTRTGLHTGHDLSYTYRSSSTGHPFQLDNISENDYYSSAESTTPKERYSHSYSYDANGNFTHERTARRKGDGHYEPAGMERKLLWDEENRLTALSENGYVSTYVYDADGERTVKMHGGGHHSFRNGTEDSLHSHRATYTLYPNAFLTYDEDGQYVKHIYMGGERVVSKIVHPMTFFVHSPKAAARADFEGYMPLSRYKAKKRLMEAAIDSSYQALGVPYLGVDRDSTSYPPSQLRMDNTSMKEDLIFFYHKDHLGSSNTILDSVGNILQWIEYLPYGEVMVDEQHSADYATPYKFNGKELDEETGLLYYGARYFDPKRVFWYSTDELEKNNPYVSTYTYCDDNPIVFYEQEGREKIIALNYRSGQNAESNRIIVKAVQNFQDNPHTINIWAHGNEKSMTVYYKNTGRSEIIRDSKSFIKLLKTNSKVWNNSKDGKNVTIVLHSCSTGAILKNGDGLAQSLSKDIPNAIIIAPDHTVKVNSSSGERGVFFNDTRMEEEMGQWNQFENGKLTKIFPGDSKVGSSDYIQ